MMLSRKASKIINEHVRQALHNKSDLLQKDAPLETSLIFHSSNTNYKLKMLQRIRKFIPNARVIFSKGFDKYVHQILKLPKQKQFPQTQYPIHVQNILQTFPRDQVGFVKFEEYVKNPVTVLERDVLPVFGVGPFSKAAQKRIRKFGWNRNQ